MEEPDESTQQKPNNSGKCPEEQKAVRRDDLERNPHSDQMAHLRLA
jgi:hypothetical protein